MNGFYKNSAFVYDYQKPYLIININSFEISKQDLITSHKVLDKFYDMKSNKNPINFAYIIIFNTFSINIMNMKKVGEIFKKLRPKTKKQVYGTAMVINKNLKNLTGMIEHILKMFKNDNPVKFVTTVEDGKKWLDTLIEQKVSK